MCGIFGILYRDGITVPDNARLVETGRILRHRGPDSVGLYSSSGIGLVQTRLSLLDLSSRSDQPFWDDQRRYSLVYNGEIYNFQTLRTELERQGVPFRTTSDTEVLLQGIIRHGLESDTAEARTRLEGMFAFGFWDSREQTLVLVRDRFGIKPLSVYEDDRVLVFASEIKAMKPWITLVPDPQAASAYLSGFGGPTRDRSFFRDVVMLAPGTIREIRSGERSKERLFFHITDFWHRNGHPEIHTRSPEKVVDHFEELVGALIPRYVQELLELLPATMRTRHNLGARLFQRLQPLAAWMPNSNSLLPMFWSPAAHKMSRRVKPVLGKVRRALLGESHRTTGSSVLYVTEPAWRKRFEGVLENGDLFDPALFDRDAVRGCWRKFAARDHTLGGDVEKLLQIGLTQQLMRSGYPEFRQTYDLSEPSL